MPRDHAVHCALQCSALHPFLSITKYANNRADFASLAQRSRYIPICGHRLEWGTSEGRSSTMRKEASLPVRLDTDLDQRLKKAAERLGLTKSALIRVLVKSFVDELEAKGGKITFPLTWKEPGREGPSSLKSVADPRSRYDAKGGNK